MQSSQAQNASDLATTIYKLLTNSRPTDKYKAVQLLGDASTKIDRGVLRSLLLDALKNKYNWEKDENNDDPSIAFTRSWIINALGRLSSDDETVTEAILHHVNAKTEPDPWARYWALEGLIVGENKKTPEIAKRVAEIDHEPLVSMLALAYVASTGLQSARKSIAKHLDEEDMQWAVLRALRVVPLPFTVGKLCELVEGGRYTDVTYDAIVALGKLQNGPSNLVLRASQALITASTNMRVSPWKDGMRTAAIAALGNLKVESSGLSLLDELTDDNPAIVKQAATAMEKILGVGTAVNRVAEAAAKSGNEISVSAYARALQWMNREAVAEELEGLMSSGSTTQQQVARALLSDVGGAVAFDKLRARTAATKQYADVLEQAENRVQVLFEQTVHEAQRGFHLATWMDLIVFGVGITLILVSAANALVKTGDLGVWAGVGSVGVLGVLYSLLISNPRRQVRDAVDHLMRVKIIFLAYLRRLHQADQAYTRLLLDNDRITTAELRDYSDMVGVIMEATTKQLAAVVEPPSTKAKVTGDSTAAVEPPPSTGT
jgi:HEAT repeat protein